MTPKKSTIHLDHIERLKLAKSVTRMGFYDWYPLENRIIWDDILHEIAGLNINSKKNRPEYFMSIIHPEDLEQVSGHMSNILDPQYEGGRFDNAFRMLVKDKLLHINTVGIRETDENGLVSRVFGIVIDDTKAVEFQNRIKDNEERLSVIVEATGLATYDFKIPEKHVFWDERLHEMFGLPFNSKKDRNQHFFDCVHPDDFDRVTANFQKNLSPLSSESDTYDEFRIIVKNELKYIRNYGTVERDHKNQPLRISGSLFDVTDIRKTEIELAESREYFQAIFRGSKDHIFTINDKWEIEFINFVAAGLTMEKVIGTPLLELAMPDDREMIREKLNLVFNEAQTVEYETTFQGPDRLFYYSTKVSPLLLKDEAKGAILITRDITDSRESQEKLREQAKELQRSNQNLEQFAYVSSHDVKAPVTNLEGLVRIMEDEDLIKDEGKAVFDKMKGTVNQMRQTIQSLNEVFSVQSNLNLPAKKLDLESILNSVLNSIDYQLEDSGAKVEYDFKNAPTCKFAETHMKSIFQNLITNSIKYHRKGVAPKIRIKSKIHKTDNKVQLDISDNGRGINMDKYGNKVFGLFQRFHLDTEGKGLGLHIIKMIIESYGGEIKVKSELNKGTTFTLII